MASMQEYQEFVCRLAVRRLHSDRIHDADLRFTMVELETPERIAQLLAHLGRIAAALQEAAQLGGQLADLAEQADQAVHEVVIDGRPVEAALGRLGGALAKDQGLLQTVEVAADIVLACAGLGLTVEDVIQGNIDKLTARFPNGFNATDALAKRDEVAA